MEHPLTQDIVPLLRVLTLGTKLQQAVPILATVHPLRALTQAMGLNHKVPTQGTGHLKKMQAHYTGHQPPPAIAHLIMMTMTTMVVSLVMAGKNKTVLQAL